MSLTHVLTPLRIGNAEIRNRVVRTAHGTNLGGGMISDDLIAYHVARGNGGVGLSIVEILGVHWSSPSTINIFLPGIEDGYRRMVAAVKPTGMKLFQQLWHAGHNSAPLDGSPPWSSSDLPGFMVGIPAIPMTKAMIDEVVGAYAESAAKMAAWGMDGVEVHAAHGYLPQQFLSPALNERTDDYGGPFENRIRFLDEVMTAIRAAVPRGFPVGVRLAPDNMGGGVHVDENLEAAQYLEGRGLIDFVNVSMGNYQTFSKMIGGMHEGAGYEMPTSKPITTTVKLPSIVTGRFRTLEEADQVIRAGEASMVSFVRALIADPDMVRKTAEGRPEQVRPCIACNQGCLARVLEPPYRMGCAINPGAGFETSIGDDKLVPATSPRRVLIVGGGPAGMEAARVAATRGHKVTLAEAAPHLGGALIAASQAPTRHGLRDLVTWLEAEIYRLGVSVQLSTYIDADDLDTSAWDAVIVATGSTPRMDGKQNGNPGEPATGMDQPHVVSSTDVMLGARANLGKAAVVIDDAGHYEALAVAEHLLNRGLSVSLVTRYVALAPKVEMAQMVEPALQRIAGLPFTQHLRSRALAVGPNSVTIAPIYLPANTNQTTELPADTVVFVSLNRGNRALFDALEGKPVERHIIGDANAARHLPTAMREGHQAGARV